MVSNKSFVCDTCNYFTNRKYNLELHKRSLNACKNRLKRDEKKTAQQNIPYIQQNVPTAQQNIPYIQQKVPETKQIIPQIQQKVSVSNNNEHICKFCNKKLSSKQRLSSHENTCNGLQPLQCPTCKEIFLNAKAKYRHIKKANCEFILSDEQQKIKDLEDQLEECGKELEEEKKKRQEAEKKSNTTINNYNITNNNNYFDHSINYNNYDNLNVDHITKEDIKRLFNNCRMQYPELSEDLTRMILSPKENQCIYLPEGQKSNTCAVIKDGVEMRKPLIRVLMDLGVQTAILIRDANVIERNKKDVINNQFWADNRNACGLNISDIEYMTDNDKEIVQRNKNIVLDMSDGKI